MWPDSDPVKSEEEFKDLSQDEIKQFCQTNQLNYTSARFPRLLSFPDSRIIESRLWAERGLLNAAKQKTNVKVIKGERVIAWLSNEESRIVGVKTASGAEVAGDVFVVANGMEAKFLAKPLGLRLPLLGAKGYSLNYTAKPGASLPPLSSTFVDYNTSSYVNTSLTDIRITGCFEFTSFDDTTPSPKYARLTL